MDNMGLSFAKENAVMTAFGQLPSKTAGGYPELIPFTKTNVVCDCGIGLIDVRAQRNVSLETNPQSSPAAAIYSVSYKCDSETCGISGRDKGWTMPS